MIATMRVNLIVTEQNLPTLQDFYCIRCRALMFKSNRDVLTLWMGPSYPDQKVPKGMGWMEYKCRNCPTTYSVYYQ